MKIVFFIGSLRMGGGERTAVVLSKAFRDAGHDVAILTYVSGTEDFFAVREGVRRKRVELGPVESARFWNVPGWVLRSLAVRRAILAERPDVVISLLEEANVLCLLSLLGSTAKRVVSVQTDIDQYPMNARHRFLRTRLYASAHHVVFLDPDQAERSGLRHRNWRVAAIPNPVEAPPESAGPCPVPLPARRHVVGVGRLVDLKGFDLLIEAFAGVARACPDWGLVILGEGPQRERLTKRAAELGITDRFSLPGAVKEPYAVLKRCDLFVLSSRYEGQGLALVEAMACGLPVISFDCPSGPRRILQDGEAGCLVRPGDTGALSEALGRFLGDPDLRSRMGKKAREEARRYFVEPILERWLDLLGR